MNTEPNRTPGMSPMYPTTPPPDVDPVAHELRGLAAVIGECATHGRLPHDHRLNRLADGSYEIVSADGAYWWGHASRTWNARGGGGYKTVKDAVIDALDIPPPPIPAYAIK